MEDIEAKIIELRNVVRDNSMQISSSKEEYTKLLEELNGVYSAFFASKKNTDGSAVVSLQNNITSCKDNLLKLYHEAYQNLLLLRNQEFELFTSLLQQQNSKPDEPEDNLVIEEYST